ncbi:MAG TPA: sulfurtransferase [Woeseiaceae bacterium]
MTGNSYLISAQELHSALSTEDIVIVDCRFDLADKSAGRTAYEAAHIPGAVYADLDRDLAAAVGPRTGRHPLPDPDLLAATFGRLGIGHQSRVVVYDTASGGIAARCWWLLHWLGNDRVQLLDGGFNAWRTAGYVVKEGVEHRSSVTFAPSPRRELVVTTAELEEALSGARNATLVDARDAARFRGEVEPIDPVAGHVPGARNMPFTAFLNPDGTWLDANRRAALWHGLFDAPPATPWAVMCGSGVTACHLVISALEAGLPEPRLYVGSWSEWITEPGRPIARGGA